MSHVCHLAAVSGSSVGAASRVDVRLEDGRNTTWFVKQASADLIENLRCEYKGLARLADTQTIQTATPLAVGVVNQQATLVTQWETSHQKDVRFFERLAASLAELHRQTLGNAIGLDQSNFLGASRQVNRPTATWVEFVACNRLGIQLRWAVDGGQADRNLQGIVERVIARLPSLLSGREQATSLLHGDLWSGNVLADVDGCPVVLDPAIYRGCREAELGMLRLFGGCPPEFEAIYDGHFPMPVGWQRRVDVYVLYHLLNHLNLFGTGYASACSDLATRLLRH
ncbi:MAG: fructosamine kinase family protein [Planctomycetota bacterium]